MMSEMAKIAGDAFTDFSKATSQTLAYKPNIENQISNMVTNWSIKMSINVLNQKIRQ